MELIDLYLKADSKQEMESSLLAAGFLEDPESRVLYHPEAALDVIGAICKLTGERVVVDGVEMEVQAPIDGYHTNVRTTSEAVANSLEHLRTYPGTPVRVWC